MRIVSLTGGKLLGRVMAELEDEAAEATETDVTDVGVALPALKLQGGRRSLSRVRREMTDDELSQPAVQKMMLDELERLDRERDDLLPYREKFAEADKECAILKEKLKPKIAADVFFGGCTTIGSIMVGLAPSAWSVGMVGYAALGLGLALVLAGIVAKVILK